MGILWSDLKLAVRVLKRAPGFSTAVILALALGIGPNTAIFSIVYATLLAPLPFPHPDQLVMAWSKVQGNRDGTSPAEYLEWKRQATSFQYLEPFWPRYFNLATPDEPERVRARQTSPRWLSDARRDRLAWTRFQSRRGSARQEPSGAPKPPALAAHGC